MAIFSDFGVLISRFYAAPADLAEGQPSEQLSDIKGRQIISGRWLEDDPHSSGDAGLFVMAVRNDNDDVLTDANLDYSPFAVDDKGRLKVLADLDADFDFVHEEDSDHASGHSGSFNLSIRLEDIDADNSALLAGTNGDYQGFFTDSSGRLYIVDNSTGVGSKDEEYCTADDLSIDDDGLKNVTGVYTDVCVNSIAAGEIAYIYGWAWDCDKNAVARLIAEIDDGGTKSSGTITINDFTGLAGEVLTINGVVYTEGVEWSAVTSDDATALSIASAINGNDDVNAIAALAVVTVNAEIAGVAGDAITMVTSDAIDITLSGAVLSGGVDPITSNRQVYKVQLNSSAHPGRDEHWSESGRIEIPGASDLKIKLQVRRRDSGAGSGIAAGSIHMRK